jgi:hypothetical protein
MISPLAYFSEDMLLEPLVGPSAGFKPGLWPSLCRLSEGALEACLACLAGLLAPAACALNSLPYHLVSLLGTSPASAPAQVLWLFELAYSLDLALLVAEACALALLASVAAPLASRWGGRGAFYDDLSTFCQQANISLTEVAAFTTTLVAFLALDAFLCSSDEDVADAVSALLMGLVLLLFVFLALGVDVQYYYMVSSAGSADPSARSALLDAANNFLCLLRIFFCWVRYIFYDLQVELVDFAFHYTDGVNDASLLGAQSGLHASAWAGQATPDQASAGSALRSPAWALLACLADVAAVLVQALVGFVKLFIASFLLWLIVDLFVLKALALSESSSLRGPRHRS